MVSSTLYLLNYNNYFNKIVKKEESLDDYLQYVIPPTSIYSNPIEKVNFIPSDNLDTEQIINWYGDDPDYILVVDEYGDIASRWFVMTTTRLRNGQYRLSLHRDVLADFMDEWMNSVAYIKKAILPSTNKLIYNSEGMSFNQIKMHEDLLYDNTKAPWIVGYVDPNATGLKGASVVFSGNKLPLTNYNDLVELSQTSIKVIDNISVINVFGGYPRNTSNQSNWNFYRYDIELNDEYTNVSLGLVKNQLGNGDGWHTSSHNFTIDKRNTLRQNTTDTNAIISALSSSFKNKSDLIINTLASEAGLYTNATNPLEAYKSRNVVYDSNGQKYYEIIIEPGVTTSEWKLPGYNQTDMLNTMYLLKNIALSNTSTNLTEWVQGAAGGIDRIPIPEFFIQYNVTSYTIHLNPISYGDYYVSLSDTAKAVEDAPFRMFCMKYTPQNYMLAIKLATENGSKFYDIQLLPYCPVREYYGKSGILLKKVLTTLTRGVDYEAIRENAQSTTALDYLFWCTNSVGTFDIEYQISINNIKEAVECDMYRLCSPNGNGQFEFNAAKNGGVLHFNVDYAYRPYDPYIHLNPNFGELYGKDFNDFRGLILNGDFSIPIVNDKWVEYTIQNKNYQNIFNREVQSMELQNRIANKLDIWSAVAGSAQAGVTGAGLGMMTGGGVQAAAGLGLASAGISALAGAADVKYNQQLRAEQINLKRDLFQMNLQNIQALPQSISKTGCLTNNNKLVPYVEYYTCTDEEKEAFAYKIKYTGMTVGTSGLISDYVSTGSGVENAKYIEADIIHIDIEEDYHIAMAIAEELTSGVRVA